MMSMRWFPGSRSADRRRSLSRSWNEAGEILEIRRAPVGLTASLLEDASQEETTAPQVEPESGALIDIAFDVYATVEPGQALPPVDAGVDDSESSAIAVPTVAPSLPPDSQISDPEVFLLTSSDPTPGQQTVEVVNLSATRDSQGLAVVTGQVSGTLAPGTPVMIFMGGVMSGVMVSSTAGASFSVTHAAPSGFASVTPIAPGATSVTSTFFVP